MKTFTELTKDVDALHDQEWKLTFLGEGTGLTLTSSTANLGGGGRGGTRLCFFLSYTGGENNLLWKELNTTEWK